MSCSSKQARASAASLCTLAAPLTAGCLVPGPRARSSGGSALGGLAVLLHADLLGPQQQPFQRGGRLHLARRLRHHPALLCPLSAHRDREREAARLLGGGFGKPTDAQPLVRVTGHVCDHSGGAPGTRRPSLAAPPGPSVCRPACAAHRSRLSYNSPSSHTEGTVLKESSPPRKGPAA